MSDRSGAAAAPPAISVCLATYEGARFLREQVDSILAQLGPDDELVVNDDCSHDDTVAILRDYADPRIRIERNPARLGYTRNFEAAMRRCRGDIVFFADQDDVWLPGKVARMVAALADHDVAVHDVRVVDGHLAELAPSHFRMHGVRRGFWVNLLRTRYIGAAIALRRPVLELVLPLPRHTRWCAYDYWIVVLAERFLRVALVDEPLMLYRRHDANASNGGATSDNSLAHRVLVRLYCLTALTVRGWRRGAGRARP